MAHETSNLTTKWRKESPYIFIKYFNKFLKVKHFTTFTNDFTVNSKYFHIWPNFITKQRRWNAENIFFKIFYSKTNEASYEFFNICVIVVCVKKNCENSFLYFPMFDSIIKKNVKQKITFGKYFWKITLFDVMLYKRS